jgi:hypothetical protein
MTNSSIFLTFYDFMTFYDFVTFYDRFIYFDLFMDLSTEYLLQPTIILWHFMIFMTSGRPDTVGWVFFSMGQFQIDLFYFSQPLKALVKIENCHMKVENCNFGAWRSTYLTSSGWNWPSNNKIFTLLESASNLQSDKVPYRYIGQLQFLTFIWQFSIFKASGLSTNLIKN